MQVIGHVLAWAIYAYASVWYHPPDVEASVILWVFMLYIPVFYSLVWLFYGLINKEKRSIYINYAVAGLVLCYISVYAFIYALLPFFGVYIYNSEVPFTLHSFIAEVSLALFRFVVYAGLYVLINSWWKLVKLKRHDRKVLQRFELQVLGKELTAHTQFGLLQHFQASSLEGEVEMQDYAVDLAAIYDYQLRATQTNMVLLSEELKAVSRVAHMLRPAYFSEDPDWMDLKTTPSTCLQETLDRPVPPLALVSLLENACKYGDLLVIGNLQMKIVGSENTLLVKCINKIGKARPWISSRGIGQRNLERRLELLFPGNAWFDTERKNGYFYATIKIRYDEKV